jgi:uncharacterized protein YjbI with pentapeptide repeats
MTPSVHRRIPYILIAVVLALIGSAFAADDALIQKLRDTRKCTLCDLSGAQLSGFNLEGVDLSGSDLHDARMYGTNLRAANLAGAILDGADLKLADLTGATDAALAGAITDDRTICPSGDHGPCQ